MKTPRHLLTSSLLLAAAFFTLPSGAAPVTVKVELDRAVLPANEATTAIVKVSLSGARRAQPNQRPPVNLALVIDRSGSMGGERIEHARAAALEALRRLAPDDILSLVTFDSRVNTLVPARRVGDGLAFERAIESITVGGTTALHGGVVQGANELRKNLENPRYVHRLILLSDGAANVGPRSPAELGALGAELMAQGVSVTTVGLGLGYNEDLMAALALRSDGNTYFVAHSSELRRIFAAELGDVLDVVARRLIVEVDFPEGIRPRRVLGREGRIDQNRVTLELNQLYGGQDRYAFVEVELPPTRPSPRPSPLGQARLRYLDENAAARSAEASVTARFSPRPDEVLASANHQVQTDHAELLLAQTRDEALALADAGRHDEASLRLRTVSSSLRETSARYNNTALGAMAPSAARDADRFQAGLSNEARKTYRAEVNHVVTQQRPIEESTPIPDVVIDPPSR